MNAPRHILDLDRDALTAWCAESGLPAYRAGQILEWIYRKSATSFEAMTNLPAGLRLRLADEFTLYTSTVARRAASTDGTLKLLLQWPDAALSECVMIPDGDRRTACVGSQVGCPVKCVFCASGLEGLERNLTAGQIVEQLLRIQQELSAAGEKIQPADEEPSRPSRKPRPADEQPSAAGEKSQPDEKPTAAGERLSNVVFMGSGEPLANYERVLAAIHTINADWGVGIGARRITISTVGLPSQIRRLAEEKLQFNLALSLHAPSDELRSRIIPWASRTPLDELVAACRHYFERSGREITLEYILLGGLNDGVSHARELARFCQQVRCNVNLIRYNPVQPLPYARPTAEASQRFLDALRQAGVNAHVRKSRGLDIDAACGQLRRREMTVPLGVAAADDA